MTTTERDPFLDGGSSLPSLKFPEVGTSHTFQIVDMRQIDDRDPAGTTRTWSNGDPKKLWVFDVNTTLDGTPATASVFVKGHLYTVIRDALRAAGIGSKGAIVKATFSEIGKPKAPGYSGAHLFTAVAKAGPALKAAAADLDPFA